MKTTIHRSENLVINRDDDTDRLELEIRFPSSFARGTCDARCPRCGAAGRAGHWELEGPDGRGNTVFFSCNADNACTGSDGLPFNWTQEVLFPDGWQDK